MRTSADSCQPEEASLESCCSASSAHGTDSTEAQTLGLLACLATSNLKSRLGWPCRPPPAALLRKCERLQIAVSQNGLAWTPVAEPPLPRALLAQSHRAWGCLLVLPPQSSNVSWETEVSCNATFASVLRQCECLQIAVSQRALAWKDVALPHLPMALLTQRHRDWGCLLVLPHQTSKVNWEMGGTC